MKVKRWKDRVKKLSPARRKRIKVRAEAMLASRLGVAVPEPEAPRARRLY